MRTNIVALPASAPAVEWATTLHSGHERRGQLLYPVVDDERRLAGVVTRGQLNKAVQPDGPLSTGDLAWHDPVVAFPDEPLRVVVYRMAETGLTRFPVVERGDVRKLVSMVALEDLLRARTRDLEEERRRERVLRIHRPFGRRAPEEQDA
jgi:CBS domain-containing protein